MKTMKQKTEVDCHFQQELFFLVMDAISPWVFPESFFDNQNWKLENWRIGDVSMKDEQVLMSVMQVDGLMEYTALICCLGEPEIVAVSCTNGNLGMLNPYLDSGHKLEADLDGPGCWNVLSITFRSEPGAQTVRFLRQGLVQEVEVNEFGCFSIIDWNSNLPVDEYLGVKVNGKWKKPVVAALPYTIDYVKACWQKAVVHGDKCRDYWNSWITAAFVELCGSDRMVLQQEMKNAFVGEEGQLYYQAFNKQRQTVLNRERSLMEQPALK